jgi:D-amino-acid oxidase
MGMTCALELARSGLEVSVHTAESFEDTCSAVSAALWFPFEAAPREAVVGWSRTSYTAFLNLSADAVTGVSMKEGIALYRNKPRQDWWTAALKQARDARPDEVIGGADAGTICTVPFVKTSVYLPWLHRQCLDAGISFTRETVVAIPGFAPEADTVVVTAGLGSEKLLADDHMAPVRGQVVQVTNPGLTKWILDDENPQGMLYIFPRGDDVICGGTTEWGSWETQIDPNTTAAILKRARELVPALAAAEVMSEKVGLRPFRSQVRLDKTTIAGRSVISCYGHGGSGVTMSWGCAKDVVALAVR